MSEFDLSSSLITYLPRVTVRSQRIYMTVLGAVALCLVSLPFIYVDVSAQAGGLVRPVTERGDVKATMGGLVTGVFVREGQAIRQGQVMFRLQSDALDTKVQLLNKQLNERRSFIRDLEKLSKRDWSVIGTLESPLYRQQVEQFRSMVSEAQQTLQKRSRELQTSKKLYNEKVIARLDFEDAQFAYQSVAARYNSLVQQQRSSWQADLTQQRLALTELEAEAKQLGEQRALYELKAPVGGTVSQVQGRYVGSFVQPGETLGVVSPDSSLVVETYVEPKDIGLIKVKQAVRFQIDAFDYNQWGLLTGRVLDIANDFTLMSNKPMFKVRCLLDKPYLMLENGYRGYLKKGMTVQARFIVTRRSLYQLLYDKADDWLNPSTQTRRL